MSRFMQVLPALVCVFIVCGAPALADYAVLKSPGDERQYEYLRLPNRLKVLLVSDPHTAKAAAALHVKAGSADDPRDYQGLAHLLEHMLLLGTEKYPDPGAWNRFISTRGGQSNAHTTFSRTSYYFDIDSRYLAPALARFAQMFSAPLLPADYIRRERHAVDAEYRSKRMDDDWRRLQVFKQAVNPGHSYSQFSIGSLATLSEGGDGKLRAQLLRFYRNHYSAGRMALVVLGKEPLATLRQWVSAEFGAIKNNHVIRKAREEPLFQPGRLPARLNIVPVKNERLLTLSFPIPATDPYYLSKPARYIGTLIADESAGGLLSLLQDKGWAESISARRKRIDDRQALFTISLRLTAAGLDNLNAAVAYVFQYLKLIREKGVNRLLFDEQRRIAGLAFRFRERGEPARYVRFLAGNLHLYPPRHVLSGSYLYDDYRPDLLERFLARLGPENVLLTVSAKGLPADSEERWFGAPYQFRRLARQTVAQWRDAPVAAVLSVPQGNQFIPDDLTIKPLLQAGDKPELININPGFALWYKQDGRFRTPRADFYFSLRSPFAGGSPADQVLSRLYVMLVERQLAAFVFPARVSGLNFKLYNHGRGISVKISGYNDKLDRLLAQVLEALRDPQLDDDGFTSVKRTLSRKLGNAARVRPHRRALHELKRMLVAGRWSPEQRLAALAPLTLDDLRRFIPKLLGKGEALALAHGNLHRREAVALARMVERELLFKSELLAVPPAAAVVRLTSGASALRQQRIDHDDSVLAAYFQGTDVSYASQARFRLLAQLLAKPFYHDLRTVRQLGYIVAVSHLSLQDLPGILFILQSPVADPVTLEYHVARFISAYAEKLAQMNEQTFERHKQSLLGKVLQKSNKLSERSERYWREITSGRSAFDSEQRLAAAIRGLNRDEIVAFYRRLSQPQSSREVAIHLIGRQH